MVYGYPYYGGYPVPYPSPYYNKGAGVWYAVFIILLIIILIFGGWWYFNR